MRTGPRNTARIDLGGLDDPGVLDDGPRPGPWTRLRAWRPAVPGVAEVLHARIVDWGYPLHAHSTWTVLIVDDGAIRYDLDRRHCGVGRRDEVAVLPPGVVHDGRPHEGVLGFRKRNLYLDASFLPAGLVGAAVDHTIVRDAALRAALSRLHDRLAADARTTHSEPWDAEARLARIGERLAEHLAPSARPRREAEPAAARELRDLLDDPAGPPATLADAAGTLSRSVPHLVRSFSRQFGVSPHAYLIGRRVEAARWLLLAGMPVGQVAAATGFYDQAHLTRHFRRHTSVTPAVYARGRR